MRPIHFQKSASHPHKFSPFRSLALEQTTNEPAGLANVHGRTRA